MPLTDVDVTVAATSRMAATARLFWRGLDLAVDTVLLVAVVIEFVAVFGNVVTRNLWGFSILWVDEVSQIVLGVIAFLGGAIAYPRGRHVAVRALAERLPAAWRPYHESFVDWVVFFLAAATVWWSGPLLAASRGTRTTVLQLPGILGSLPVTIGGALLMLYTLRAQWHRPWRAATCVGAALIVLFAAVGLTHAVWQPALANHALELVLLATALLLIVGVPAGPVLLCGAFVYFYLSDPSTSSMVGVPAALKSVSNGVLLLALPFFVLAGSIMANGGLSERMVRFIVSLVGHFRGGMLQAVIISMYVFSGISGSKSADMAAIGGAMHRSLRSEGYDDGETVAVLCASAAMSETVPPSVVMIALGSVSTVEVSALFVAGLLPAVVLAICLSILVYIRARKSAPPPLQRVSAKVFAANAANAVLAILMPAILFVGIVFGIATPEEVSAVAIAYGLLVSFGIYRSMTPMKLVRSVNYTTTLVGMILYLVAASTAFSFALNVQGLPLQLASTMTSLGSAVPFIAVTIVVMLVLGAIHEGLPALLIFGSLLIPQAPLLGLNPLYYGIVLIIAMGVGSHLPSFGGGFFNACSICETSVERAVRPMIAYSLVLVVGLIVIAFVPSITLVLPRLFHLA